MKFTDDLLLAENANLLAKLRNSAADLRWYARIQNATPHKANQLFYDCWRFVHNFDKKLRTL